MEIKNDKNLGSIIVAYVFGFIPIIAFVFINAFRDTGYMNTGLAINPTILPYAILITIIYFLLVLWFAIVNLSNKKRFISILFAVFAIFVMLSFYFIHSINYFGLYTNNSGCESFPILENSSGNGISAKSKLVPYRRNTFLMVDVAKPVNQNTLQYDRDNELTDYFKNSSDYHLYEECYTKQIMK